VQRSQRYVNEDRFQYVKPAGLENKTIVLTVPGTDGHIISLDYDQFQDLVAQMYNGYIFLGAKAEDARYVLTNGTFTKLHVSFDWEALKNFCERRCCSRTQWEIRDIANLMRDEVSDVNEFLGKRLGAYCETHGYCPEVKGCGKAMSLATMKEYAWRYDTIKDKYI
jgi:thymidylate synthase (FAD)